MTRYYLLTRGAEEAGVFVPSYHVVRQTVKDGKFCVQLRDGNWHQAIPGLWTEAEKDVHIELETDLQREEARMDAV